MYCGKCGIKLLADSKYCPSCGQEIVTREPISNDHNQEARDKGIGGWLIFIAISLIINPFRLLALVKETIAITQDAAWELVTNSVSGYYISGIGLMTNIEIIVNSLLFLAVIYAAFLFFRKKRQFPRTYIAILAISLFFSIVSFVYILSIPALKQELSAEDFSGLIGGIIAAAIWIPYMLKSKRVKATFVNCRKDSHGFK